MREIVQECLEHIMGWQITTASSGQEGLEKIAQERPDGVVLDFMMPGLDGLDLLRLLRQIPDCQALPVGLLTAKLGLLHPYILPSISVAGAIAKPFDPNLLPLQLAHFFGWN